MKKTIVLGSILAASMLSGCFFATETITCTKTEEESGMNSTQKIEAVFKSKKVQSINMDVTIDLSDQTDEMVDIAKSALESTYNEMETEGIATNVEQKDKTLTVNIDLDFEKASKEALENVDSNFGTAKDEKVDTAQFIEEMENEGYTCEK